MEGKLYQTKSMAISHGILASWDLGEMAIINKDLYQIVYDVTSNKVDFDTDRETISEIQRTYIQFYDTLTTEDRNRPIGLTDVIVIKDNAYFLSISGWRQVSFRSRTADQADRIAKIDARLSRLNKILGFCTDQDSEVVQDLKELYNGFLKERNELVLISTIIE